MHKQLEDEVTVAELGPDRVAEAMVWTVTRPREQMIDVIHVRAAR